MSKTNLRQELILGSSSPFRKELLDRLCLTYSTDSPDINEGKREHETPKHLVQRLAIEKAQAVAPRHPEALIIGSDQVAVINNTILGKPGTKEKAFEQLTQASGKCVIFLTGLCLLEAKSGQYQVDVIPYSVHFRDLTKSQIDVYITEEQPLNCAGSFKSEGLGIALFEKMEGDDPTALIGLPLIRLVAMLQEAGVDVL